MSCLPRDIYVLQAGRYNRHLDPTIQTRNPIVRADELSVHHRNLARCQSVPFHLTVSIFLGSTPLPELFKHIKDLPSSFPTFLLPGS
jgi:hypothetical protein